MQMEPLCHHTSAGTLTYNGHLSIVWLSSPGAALSGLPNALSWVRAGGYLPVPRGQTLPSLPSAARGPSHDIGSAGGMLSSVIFNLELVTSAPEDSCRSGLPQQPQSWGLLVPAAGACLPTLGHPWFVLPSQPSSPGACQFRGECPKSF